jgi:hypothetical protein
MKEKQEINFLNKKYGLHNSSEVKKAIHRKVTRSKAQNSPLSNREGQQLISNPELKTELYIDRLESILSKNNGFEILNKMANKIFVLRQRLELSNKSNIINHIQNQTESLNKWVQHLAVNESMYSKEFKYITIRTITKLGQFNKDKLYFEKRSKSSTAPFIEVNPKALDLVYEKYTANFEIIFEKEYAIALHQIEIENRSRTTSKNNIIAGNWKKFDKKDQSELLEKSISGFNTNWCTVGTKAKEYLGEGELLVFYSENDDTNQPYEVPRIAIKLKNGQIEEVSGINHNQTIEPSLLEILKQKASSLAGFDKYMIRIKNGHKLNKILDKVNHQTPLTSDELRFVYQIDSPIILTDQVSTAEKETKIKTILTNRHTRQDLAKIFGCQNDQIGFSEKEILQNNIVYFQGELNLSKYQVLENKILPYQIKGNLDLSGLEHCNNLTLPRIINGDLFLSKLKYVDNLDLGEKVDGYIDLSSLESAKNLTLPKVINGYLDLGGLKTVEGLKLPVDFDIDYLYSPFELRDKIIKNRSKYSQSI